MPSLILPARRLRRVPFKYTLQQLGVTSGLKLCLDAGDVASWPGSGTKWLDTSGNGYDFTITGATFNGTVGKLTGSEYWGLDGGDYFTYDTTNETWMTNIHKDNALFTLMVWAYISSSSVARALMGTTGQSAATGFAFQVGSANNLAYTCRNGASPGILIDDDTPPATSAWSLFGLTYDEATNNSIFQQNASFAARGATYASASTGAAAQTMQIGARGAGSSPLIMPNGDRLGGVMCWEGVALTQAQMTSVFQAQRFRFGV